MARGGPEWEVDLPSRSRIAGVGCESRLCPCGPVLGLWPPRRRRYGRRSGGIAPPGIFNFSPRFCQDTRSNADGKDLEDWDGVVDALEVGRDAEIGAKGGPNPPVGGVGAGS